jgi:hypothetical protein
MKEGKIIPKKQILHIQPTKKNHSRTQQPQLLREQKVNKIILLHIQSSNPQCDNKRWYIMIQVFFFLSFFNLIFKIILIIYFFPIFQFFYFYFLQFLEKKFNRKYSNLIKEEKKKSKFFCDFFFPSIKWTTNFVGGKNHGCLNIPKPKVRCYWELFEKHVGNLGTLWETC